MRVLLTGVSGTGQVTHSRRPFIRSVGLAMWIPEAGAHRRVQ